MWRARYESKPQVKARAAAAKRRTLYGISEADQAAMLEAQGHRCGSCGDHLVPGKNGRGIHLDHDHETGEIRAFTCNGCNAAIGQLKDSPLRARKLAAYLEKHAPKLKLIR